ncbi:MAG: NrdH-redoxin [Myxococcota bacterium]|nr:NrdH-redoxin [Myxococcota bacterium]
MNRRGRNVATSVMLALLIAGACCKRPRPAPTSAPQNFPVVVKPDTEGLLLTWVDDKGDFHVEMRVADVPMMGRDSVRVADPAMEDGTNPERIYVVDLRATGPDGTYPIRTMSRGEFEAIAVARREKTGPTLASAAPPPASAGPSGTEPTGMNKPASRPAVIVYGAEWCGACHDAARYLRRKGVAFVEKDVEKDASAAREMQQKLAKNGLQAGSIPVIDVRGKLMIGFNAAEVDAALGAGI